MPFIHARYVTRCPVCLMLIFPDQVIGNVPRVGFIHSACTEFLDQALPEPISRRIFGTYRIRAEIWSNRHSHRAMRKYRY